MRHAGADTLVRLEPLRDELRAHGALVEKRPGVFHWRGRAFLHFHEDPAGLFADVRVGEEWLRLRVGTRAEQRDLLRRIDELVHPKPSAPG